MNNLKGTKTEKNLMEAFAGESQARNKYTYFASKAKKEGYEQVPTTLDNLKDAASGENHEWTNMYDRMAKEAREEGFTRIAFLFEEVGKIEKEHEARYKKLLANINNELVFSSEGDTIWVCRNCGHIVVGKKAPEVCPVCAHAKSFFERKAENY